MQKTIEAVFENGVFKPLEEVNIKEHEKVRIKILSKDEWQRRFNSLIKQIHKKTAQYPAKDIEADISQAVKEVRKEKHAR